MASTSATIKGGSPRRVDLTCLGCTRIQLGPLPKPTAGLPRQAPPQPARMGRSTREQWERLPLRATAYFLFDVLCDGIGFDGEPQVRAPTPALARQQAIIHAGPRLHIVPTYHVAR